MCVHLREFVFVQVSVCVFVYKCGCGFVCMYSSVCLGMAVFFCACLLVSIMYSCDRKSNFGLLIRGKASAGLRRSCMLNCLIWSNLCLIDFALAECLWMSWFPGLCLSLRTDEGPRFMFHNTTLKPWQNASKCLPILRAMQAKLWTDGALLMSSLSTEPTAWVSLWIVNTSKGYLC